MGNRAEENIVQKEAWHKILFTYAKRKAKPFVIPGKQLFTIQMHN